MTVSTSRTGLMWRLAKSPKIKQRNIPRELCGMKNIDGDQYQKVSIDGWVFVGHFPEPKTRLGWFVFHMVHGLMMRYPLHSVIAWSLLHADHRSTRNRRRL